MRAQRLFFAVLIAFISTFSVTAQEIIPVDSIHQLSKEQKQLLQYAKVFAKKKHNKIKLPIEINRMLGDRLNRKRYESMLKMTEAYFVDNNEAKAALVVPMQARVDTLIINSELTILLTSDDTLYELVYTLFTLPNNTTSQYMCVKSSPNGFLYSTVFVDDDKIVAEVKGKDADKAGVVKTNPFNNQLREETDIFKKIPQGLSSGPSISTRLNRLSRATAIDGTYMMEKDRNL